MTDTKRYFRVFLSGYGGERVYGSLTQEQYEFWKDLDEEDIIAHAFWDPWEENNENPIFDDEDPRFLGYWHENDDLFHENGVSEDTAYITVEEYDGKEYNSNLISTLFDRISWKDFQTKYNSTVDENDLEEVLENTQYVFSGYSSEKGIFGDYSIVTNGADFDPTNLGFILTSTPYEVILEATEYDGVEIYNDGGDTTGKGYSAEIWKII
jgi:hypothetical protein